MATILLIDDERPTLEMLSLFLGAYGYTALTAENGEQGIEVFKEQRPEIVMTDIKMPGMDGIEVLKRIKAIAPATEVIVVTGHGDMELAIQALNLSATDFINKPVQKDSLEAALRRAEERLQSSRGQENEIHLKQVGDATIVHIHGNVTSHSEPFLQDACNQLVQHEVHKVVFCFDENATINGAGIALLTQILLESSKKGKRLAITGVSENFKKVFDIVGISKFAVLADSEEQALAAIDSP